MRKKLNTFGRTTSLRRLRAFAAVIEHGSLASAANALNVTAPAVSLQLRELEDEAGLPLFERTRRGLVLTDAGREVQVAAARVEMALRDCGEALEGLRGIASGHVSVAVISTAKYFAPHVLGAFKAEHPGVELRLLVGNRSDIIRALQGFDADLAVMGRPPQDFPIEQAAIGPHPHVIIARPDHPMAGGRTLALADLAGQSFLLREPGSGTRMLAEAVFGAAGVQPRIDMEIGSNETIKQAVMAGLGIAFISAHTVAAEVQDGRLAVLPVAGLPVTRQWYVVKRAERRLLPAGRELWQFLATRAVRFLPDTSAFTQRRAMAAPLG
ncbi:MAG: LysR family transcriptional regulator [Geminicoccaceae bacterium]